MNILIIDDNQHHAELAKRRLQKEGWEVTVTDDPVIDSKLSQYHFIVLDYSMPRYSGLEILKNLKDQNVRVPVILMTGHGNEIIASEAIKLGAYDYLIKDTKLIYLDRLPSVIREAKSKHELIETNRFLIQELRRANDRLQRLTFTDEMTGVYNYRFLTKQLETEISRAKRYDKALCLCLIDVDFFKQINDQYGHPGGDLSLKAIANILKDTVRGVDYVGRYAGDEFLIIFPDTELEDATRLCERILSELQSRPIRIGETEVKLSLSIGVSAFDKNVNNAPDKLIEAADRCLYEAKEAGRNRVYATRKHLKTKTKVLEKTKALRQSL